MEFEWTAPYFALINMRNSASMENEAKCGQKYNQRESIPEYTKETSK